MGQETYQRDSPRHLPPEEGSVDLLVVGDVDKENLGKFLDTLETEEPIKFSVLKSEDFVYRLKCRDQFILDLSQDSGNMIAINKLGIEAEKI